MSVYIIYKEYNTLMALHIVEIDLLAAFLSIKLDYGEDNLIEISGLRYEFL